MIDTVYIEEDVLNHEVTEAILSRLNVQHKIICERFGEVFNRKSQNFRLQKQKPALILARKHKGYVLPAPAGYGIGSDCNFYFSHMMNCIYDCRYCFLQGMYQSANYVVFVNFDDFLAEIEATIESHPDKKPHFFSGYDCDSLALEPITHFTESCLPIFEKYPEALIELRTKSTQIRHLLNMNVMQNVVVAYSLSPEVISQALEAKTPNTTKRIEAMKTLQAKGWQVGLRFDPIIWSSDYQQQYQGLFETTFATLDSDLIHSISLGSFRLPNDFYKKLEKLYPDEKLLASPMSSEAGMTSYKAEINNEMLSFCKEQILKHIPADKFFPCYE